MVRDEPIIILQDVHKRFGHVHALRGVNLEIYPAEVVVVIGPSGSGKSTMLRCINHLEAIDSGHIVVDGIPLDRAQNINKVRAEVGIVFQLFNLFPHLTALENIMLAQKVVRKRKQKEAEKNARDLLVKVGIPEKAQSYPSQLSGGQQQRVAIARALVNNPAIVMADEPTGNLDSKSGDEIMDLLLKLNHERGATLIIVTHDPEIAEQTQRVIHIRDGIVADA